MRHQPGPPGGEQSGLENRGERKTKRLRFLATRIIEADGSIGLRKKELVFGRNQGLPQ
jgi:hypothetical protein